MFIKMITAAALLFATTVTATADETFSKDLVVWTHVQTIEESGVDQWSIVIDDGRGLGRIDLVHTDEHTFFMTRRPCSDGTVAFGRISLGHKMNDLGRDCDGRFPYPQVIASWEKYTESLPAEAKALMH